MLGHAPPLPLPPTSLCRTLPPSPLPPSLPPNPQQMSNFILQEAHEKANEIRLKTEHDFNLEKQTLIHNAKLAVKEEFLKKEKAKAIEARIAASASLGSSRLTKQKYQTELLNSLNDNLKSQIGSVSKDKNYPNLMKNLIIKKQIKSSQEQLIIFLIKEH